MYACNYVKVYTNFSSFAEPEIFFYRVLCETVKDFATHILEASLNTGDQQLGEKCETLQQKLDLLLQTLSKEENYLSDNVEEIDIGTPNTETLNSNQEKGALEKPEKEMTNLKKVRKKRCYMERDAVMSRYIHNAYYL